MRFISLPLETAMPDRDDEPFLEVAVAANAESPDDDVPLVTANSKHFREESRQGVPGLWQYSRSL